MKSLLITYRKIDGYTSEKEYDKIIVLDGSDYNTIEPLDDYAEAGEQVKKISQAYHALKTGDISEVIMYIGLYGMHPLGTLAYKLDQPSITLVGCKCRVDEKKELAKRIKATFITSECGGQETRGLIADYIQQHGTIEGLL